MDNIPSLEDKDTDRQGSGGVKTDSGVIAKKYPAVPESVNNQNPGYNEYGQIEDPDKAQGIANAGKQREYSRQGRLENMYRAEAERKARENQNIEIGRMLFKEFPNAIKKIEDPKGEEVYQTGIAIQDYEGIMQDSRVPEAKRKELEQKLEQLTVDAFFSESNTTFLALIPPLIRPGKGVFLTKEGYVRTNNPEYRPTEGVTHRRVEEDSISSLSENQKEVFFKTLSFLDEVGRISNELGLQNRETGQSESNKDGIEDLQNMARSVKQN
jgi:hypothetical protein